VVGALIPVEPRRIVLLGFMGSGKSTVGPILARRLGWIFIDLDREIVAAAGLSVPEIFAGEGEPGFRRREAEATRRVISRDRLVLAPGGGWVANPDASGTLPEGTLEVWLRTSVSSVLRRVRRSRHERPLLAGSDPESTVRRLMAEREPLYRRAGLTVRTDGRNPSRVAEEIENLMRAGGAAAASS
jgi:shikimate kinase